MKTFRNHSCASTGCQSRLPRALVLAALFSALALLGSATAPSAAAQVETIPVARVLNADGTLNTGTGASGSLDLRGWNVRLDSARGPVLSPAGGSANTPLAVNDWSALGTGVNGEVYAIAISGSGDIYAGGNFTTAGTCTSGCGGIAKFSGGTWSALGTGTNGAVDSIAISGVGDVYAGGSFTIAGTTCLCDYIAKFSGGAWSALGTGTNGEVFAIAISGSEVYAGGKFTAAGTCTSNCNYIAKFVHSVILGDLWLALGTGVSGGLPFPLVYAIAVNGSDVYAGGRFAAAGTCTSGCAGIAKFSGGTWSALGTGMNGYVYAIAISDSNVYAGGQFTTAGACTSGCGGIAKFSGGAWSALGTGTNDSVSAIALSGSDVYAGGYFTSAGTCTSGCNFIAKFDGSTWSALGGVGMNGPVYANAVGGSDLYAGGLFVTAGTCNVNCKNIAKLLGFHLFLPLVVR